MSSPETYLLKGPMPDLPKCTEWNTITCAECKKPKCPNPKLKPLEKLVQECQMWRNVWGWTPQEVKYYVARIGQEVGATLRNYKRYLGTLLDSHWRLESLEVGTVDKVYDQVRDKTYWEKKIVVIPTGAVIDLQWIKERKEWEQFEKEAQDAQKALEEEKAQQEQSPQEKG